MDRAAILVSYDGTGFAGWQSQPNDRTVQDEIESALKELTGKSIRITGSGRTDSGVHAAGQVAHLDISDCSIPPSKFYLALNTRLPEDIRILKSIAVDSGFHARYSAVRRDYGYYIYNGDVVPAHKRRFCLGVRDRLNLKKLNRMASVLVGVHDFSAFAAAGDQSKSRVREIYSAGFFPEGNMTVFRISGNAFLWRMVRSVTGTLLDVSLRGGNEDTVKDILESGKRDSAGPTAPARALFLERIDYGSKYSFY